MNKIKIYLYDSEQESNGFRGEDLSQYVLIGFQNTENLTEELDVSDITLQGIDRAESFAPETKFIIDIFEEGEDGEESKLFTYHRIVSEDLVEKPILSDDHYFKHSISLIEPSAIAQKRIVDNIAVTYKLKDVNLETRTAFDAGRVAVTEYQNRPNVQPTRGFANYVDKTFWSDTRNVSFGKYFEWKKPNGTHTITMQYKSASGSDDNYVSSSKYYNNISEIRDHSQVDTRKFARFEVPVPHIMWGIEDTQAYDEDNPRRPPILQSPAYADIGVASFTVTIIEKNAGGNETARYTEEFISYDNIGQTANTKFPYKRYVIDEPDYYSINYLSLDGVNYDEESFASVYLLETASLEKTAGGDAASRHITTLYFSKYTELPTNAETVNYSTEYVTTDEIEVKEGYSYSIIVNVKNLANDKIPISFDVSRTADISAVSYSGSDFVSFCYYKDKYYNRPYVLLVNEFSLSNNNQISTEFTFYGVEGIQAVIASGAEYSALNLIKKAIINSDVYFAQDALSSVDLDAQLSPYPFYVSHDTGENILSADDLALIRINETFYHQKNLWEILLDVGKYAHAIPQITFGDNDRLAISFYKLGTTNKREQGNTQVSIMNYRKIDEYISACSSYVDNLVQLGGYITEKVAPKTISDDYIVSNNTAKIIVSKPILEILKVKVYPTVNVDLGSYYGTIYAGEEMDITNYIYEKAIYNILSVRPDQVPNKGIALYYELGESEIKGGDYQLPQAVTNAYSDYAFKKIIYSAYRGYPANIPSSQASGPWVDIKINDFIFTVIYRTKDTARLEHCRPDLRHYLLTTPYDRVPSHKQFNNQQDILVDSVAFGANMFGKLIRTGNNNYKTREWAENLGSIKHKGELYDINGEWYYVAKVTNIFFPEHIESVVEYSKDYNQLSSIIGIPSEPRFYEISERSSIDREVSINDYLLVTTDENKIDTTAGMISNIMHTKNLIMGNGGTFLRWAETTFKGDEYLPLEDQATFGLSTFKKSTMLPISAYSCGNTLTYEWDMADNFSAGDEVGEEVQPTGVGKTKDDAYRTMKAVQYCDKYGKATLLDFRLMQQLDMTGTQIRLLPNSPYEGAQIKTRAIIDARPNNIDRFADIGWLLNYENGEIIQPTENSSYYVSKTNGQWDIQGVTLFVEDIEENVPTDQAQLETYLTNKLGRQPTNTDCLMLTVYANDYSITKKITLYYSFYPITAERWSGFDIFNNSLNEDVTEELYFGWDEENQRYISQAYAYGDNVVVTNVNLNKSIVLLKDSRETLHFNYNLMQIVDSDTFVLSPFFFEEKKGIGADGEIEKPGIKIVALSAEVNKMSNGWISMNNLVAENTSPTINVGQKMFMVDMSWINALDDGKKDLIKSIAIVQKEQGSTNMVKFILAKNLPSPPSASSPALNWYFGAPNKDAIWNRQNGNRQ